MWNILFAWCLIVYFYFFAKWYSNTIDNPLKKRRPLLPRAQLLYNCRNIQLKDMKFQYCGIEIKWTLSSQSQCVTKCCNPKSLGEKPGKIDMRWRYIVFLNFLPSILSFLLITCTTSKKVRKRLALLTVSSHLMFVDKQSDLSSLVEQ